MLSFTVVAGLLLVVLTKVGSVPVKESGTLLQLNTILERNSKLHVKISIDSGAGSQGAAYIGLCGSGSCCAFHLTGFSKENVVAESYAVSDTDNIGYQDGGRGNLAEAQWGQVDQRYGPDGWRDSEVNVVVQRLDDVFGLSMAGQEDSDENVFWVGCPSDANVLQVDSRSMGSRNISRLDTGELVRLGPSLQPGELVTVTVTAGYHRYGTYMNVVFMGLCGTSSCVTVGADEARFYTGLTENNNLQAIEIGDKSNYYGKESRTFMVAVHPSRILEVWDPINGPRKRAAIRIPTELYNEDLTLVAVCSGSYVSARSNGVQPTNSLPNPFLDIRPLPEDYEEFPHLTGHWKSSSN